MADCKLFLRPLGTIVFLLFLSAPAVVYFFFLKEVSLIYLGIVIFGCMVFRVTLLPIFLPKVGWRLVCLYELRLSTSFSKQRSASMSLPVFDMGLGRLIRGWLGRDSASFAGVNFPTPKKLSSLDCYGPSLILACGASFNDSLF